jgi:predicted transcriptional regulator
MKKHPVSLEDAETIAEFCRMVRAKEKRSTREWASDLGIIFAYISKIERGEIKKPLSYLEKIRVFLSKKEYNHALNLLMKEVE